MYLVDEAFSKLEELDDRVQKQFVIWSSDPPRDGNRQTRFANTLDKWNQEGSAIVSMLRLAAAEGPRLPSAFKKCSPHEKTAKQILAGLAAMQTDVMLEDQFAEIQALANRARQPLNPTEFKQLQDEFADLVKRLALSVEELREVKKLIQEARQRAQQRVDEEAGQATPHGTPSGVLASRGATLRKKAKEISLALEKLEYAVDKLCQAIGGRLGQMRKESCSLRARKSLIDMHDDVSTATSAFAMKADKFLEMIADEDCREVLAAARGSVHGDIASRFNKKIEEYKERSDALWCWINAIQKRETQTYMLDPGIPKSLSKSLRDLGTIRRKLRLHAEEKPACAAGDEEPEEIPAVDLTALPAKHKTILQALLGDPPAGQGGHTLQSLAPVVGLNTQTLRRTLNNELGDNGGIGIVGWVKQRDKQGKQNANLGHLFFIKSAYVAAVRAALQGR